jgi:hypothetical protein
MKCRSEPFRYSFFGFPSDLVIRHLDFGRHETFRKRLTNIVRRRLPISRATRPAFRRGFRRASRHALRRAVFRAPRRLLKDNGPSLHDLCNLVSRYIRMAEAFEKKWNPPARFKTIGTPEEHRRQVEHDLQRAYGDGSPLARPPTPQPAPAAPATPPGNSLAQTAQQNSSRGSGPQPRPKRDVIAVPLVRHANGLLGLDWDAVRSD